MYLSQWVNSPSLPASCSWILSISIGVVTTTWQVPAPHPASTSPHRGKCLETHWSVRNRYTALITGSIWDQYISMPWSGHKEKKLYIQATFYYTECSKCMGYDGFKGSGCKEPNSSLITTSVLNLLFSQECLLGCCWARFCYPLNQLQFWCTFRCSSLLAFPTGSLPLSSKVHFSAKVAKKCLNKTFSFCFLTH